ncbi:MAG: hypothetical protein ABFC90_09555 [Bacteroidales bacterium]|nr:hypothetical protein [Bacteroidales bacterium]
MAKSNHKFPHHLTVKRGTQTGTNAMPDFKTEIILESECVCYLSTTPRIISEYEILIPSRNIKILQCDDITVKNEVETFDGIVVASQINKKDTIIYFNRYDLRTPPISIFCNKTK